MTFQVPESKRSIAQNRFHFQTPDGVEHSMPKMKYFTMRQIERMSSNTDELTLTDILAIFDEDESDVREAVLDFDHEQLQALMEAWQADSGLALGESSAS